MTSCRSVSNITYHIYDSCLLHPLVPLFIHFVEHNRHGAHKPPWVSCSLCSHYPGYWVWETSVDFIVHVSWSLWYISPKLWCLVSFTIFSCLFVECLCMGSKKDYFELELEQEEYKLANRIPICGPLACVVLAFYWHKSVEKIYGSNIEHWT